MLRLARVTAVIKWIIDNEIPMDLSFVKKYVIPFVSTPITTPAIITYAIPTICPIGFQGGVTYDTPNNYNKDSSASSVAKDVGDAANQNRPSETMFSWKFTEPPSFSVKKKRQAPAVLTAVAQTLGRTPKTGANKFSEIDLSYPIPSKNLELSLVRSYNSFDDSLTGMGFSWKNVPTEIRFPVGKRKIAFGASSISYEVFSELFLADFVSGTERPFYISGVDGSGLPTYLPTDSTDFIKFYPNGNFTLTNKLKIFEFYPDGRIAKISDRNNIFVQYSYDPNNNLKTISEPASGASITLTYSTIAPIRLISASMTGNSVVSYQYNSIGDLENVTLPSGRKYTYKYDSERRISQIYQNNILQATYSYDIYNRVQQSTVQSSGYSAQTDYSLKNFRQSSTSNLLGKQSESILYSDFRTKEFSDLLGRKTYYAYYGDIGIDSIVNPSGDATRLIYDIRGNLVAIYTETGAKPGELMLLRQIFYDLSDRVLATKDANGISTAYEYDSAGNLIAMYQDATLEFGELNSTGLLINYNYPNSKVITFTNDKFGNVISAQTYDGRMYNVTRDPVTGLPLKKISPIGQISTLSYDSKGRLTQSNSTLRFLEFKYNSFDQIYESYLNGEKSSYNYNSTFGFLDNVTDPFGRGKYFYYDSFGRVQNLQDWARNTFSFARDSQGLMTSVSVSDSIRQRVFL